MCKPPPSYSNLRKIVRNYVLSDRKVLQRFIDIGKWSDLVPLKSSGVVSGGMRWLVRRVVRRWVVRGVVV